MGVLDMVLRLPGIRGMVATASKSYRGAVERDLRAMGLRYDDLLNEFDPEVKKALENLPADEAELRWKRLKRAVDLDLKKTSLHPDLQTQVDVWNPYLRDRIAHLKSQRVEKQMLE